MSTFLEELAASFRQRFPENPPPQVSSATVPTTAVQVTATPAGQAASGTSAPPTVSPVGTAAASAAPPPTVFEYRRNGVHFDATVLSAQVVEAARLMDERGFALDTVTGVDWIAQDQMEVVYDFFHPIESWRAAFRTRVPRGQPELPTIQEIFPGANWHERETHDFFGIKFLGHPDLSPLLLPEDATYHPLRKDFTT